MTATEANTEPSFDELAAAVDDARRAVDALPTAEADTARHLQASIEAFHRPALVQIVRTLREDPRGTELLFELVDDPAVRAVFALHGIIRADPLTRANAALDGVRPYLQSHGGDVELVELDGSTAVVRLLGSCNGCSMSSVTLREGVEEALVNGLEEITDIRVVEDEPTTAFIPVEAVGRRRSAESGWSAGPAVADLEPDAPTATVVGDASVIITQVDQQISVFRNECVHQGLPLDGGTLCDGVLQCPWHGFSFDAVSGECISAPGAQLQALPARIEDGVVWVRSTDG